METRSNPAIMPSPRERTSTHADFPLCPAPENWTRATPSLAWSTSACFHSPRANTRSCLPSTGRATMPVASGSLSLLGNALLVDIQPDARPAVACAAEILFS